MKGNISLLNSPKGAFTVEEVPVSDPKRSGVLVKQRGRGVWGEDVAHFVRGRLPPQWKRGQQNSHSGQSPAPNINLT